MNKDEFTQRLRQAPDDTAVLDQQVLKRGKHIAKGDHYLWQGENDVTAPDEEVVVEKS